METEVENKAFRYLLTSDGDMGCFTHPLGAYMQLDE